MSLLKAFRWIRPTSCSYLQHACKGPKGKHQQHFPCLSSHLLHIPPGGLRLGSSPLLQPYIVHYPPAPPARTAPPADHLQAGPYTIVQTWGDLPVMHQRSKQPSGASLVSKGSQTPSEMREFMCCLGLPRSSPAFCLLL